MSKRLCTNKEGVPNKPYAEAFEASGMTLKDFSAAVGIDPRQVGTMLGRFKTKNRYQTHISVGNAQILSEALGIDMPEIEPLRGDRFASSPRAEIPNAPIREAFQRSELTAADLGRSLGVSRSRIRRMLGICDCHTYKNGKHYRSRQSYVTYENGVKLAKALGVDPYVFGV